MHKHSAVTYAFFIIAVVAFLLIGLVMNNWLMAVLVGLLGVIVGVFYYRRGK